MVPHNSKSDLPLHIHVEYYIRTCIYFRSTVRLPMQLPIYDIYTYTLGIWFIHKFGLILGFFKIEYVYHLKSLSPFIR